MQQAEIKVYAREALFVKKSDLPKGTHETITNSYKLRFYEDAACQGNGKTPPCEWLQDRHCPTCDNCAAFKGGVDLAKDVKIGSSTYLSIPAGDLQGLKELLPRADFVIKKKHEGIDFKRPIKFTGTLKDFQEEAVSIFMKKKRGVIKAPPRSGKTVLATAAACRIGGKTLILAAQREWLDGFYETFCGSESQKPLTNAKKSQVGFCKTLSDFDKHDVCLVTYQTFLSTKGRKLLKKLRDTFSTVVVDEVHMGAATQFAIVISRLNAQYFMGLSGTPSRKDNKYLIVAKLLGKVIYSAKVERLRPTVRLVRTQYEKNYKGNVLWTTMVSSLEKDPKRLKLIAEWAIKDAKQGHMVLIPFAQVIPIKALVLAINRMAGKKMAHAFYGGVKTPIRKQLIQDARSYKARIIVGNTKLLSTGINIPRASCLYDTTMSSNRENCEQRVSRILTPWEDKPPPMLRIFLDNSNVRKRCLANEWWQCIMPKFKPIIADKDLAILKGYLAQKDKNDVPSWEL